MHYSSTRSKNAPLASEDWLDGEPQQEAQEGGETSPGFGLVETCVLLSVLLPCLLYFPGTLKYRAIFRFAPSIVNAVLFVYWLLLSKRQTNYYTLGGTAFLFWISFRSFLLLYPSSQYLSGIASITHQFLNLAPLLFLGDLVRSKHTVRRITVILMVVALANSLMGILQVVDPSWNPKEFEINPDSVSYLNEEGETIVRPAGFSAAPGRAVAWGKTLFLISCVGLFLSRSPIFIALSLIGLPTSFVVMSATLVRSAIISSAIACVAMMLLLVLRGSGGRVIVSFLVGSVFLGVSLALASQFLLVSDVVLRRLETIVEKDPISLYYDNRGGLADRNISLAAVYPVGRGVGHTGNYYSSFADPSKSGPIWAETQFDDSLVEGGVIAFVVFFPFLICLVLTGFSASFRYQKDEYVFCAVLAFGLTISACAICFSYVPFIDLEGQLMAIYLGLCKYREVA